MKADVKPPLGPRGFDQRLVPLFNSMPLFNDPRAHSLWKQLLMRHRDGSFQNPALESVPGANAEERQTRAMTQLFKTAYDATHMPKRAVTRREAEEKRARLRAKAEELRADANWWLEAGPDKADPDGVWRSVYPDHYYDVLMEASEAYDEMADIGYATDMRFAVNRARGRSYARWLAATIAARARALFGKDLYGVTATLVSIASDLVVSRDTVKNWCRPPANKARKSGP
jgi:hypothetical protein